MLAFILQMAMMVSFGAILFVFMRVLPRVRKREETVSPDALRQPHWTMAYIEKIDEKLIVLLEKFLRRIRLLILKLDNAISGKIDHFRKELEKEHITATGEKEEKKEDDSLVQ